VACVAVPLSTLGEALAAVSVSVPVHRFPVRQRAALAAAMLEGRFIAAASA
jgi:DNA-binding IclR family transcriptional regulator